MSSENISDIKNHDMLNSKSGRFHILSNNEHICKESLEENDPINDNDIMLWLNDELEKLEQNDINEYADKLSGCILKESLVESSKLLSNIDNNDQIDKSCWNVHLAKNSSTSDSCMQKKEEALINGKFTWRKKDLIMLVSSITIIFLKYLLFNYSLKAQSLISTRKSMIESFFPHSPWIVDYSDGNGASIDSLLSKSEIVIIYYYAPWCKHSIIHRDAYSNIAKLFQKYDNIKFYAVNCFEPKGECRKTFKLYNFPIITAYLNSNKYVQFLSDFNEENLFKWLNYILYPISRVNDQIQLDNYIDKYRSIFVGFFPSRSIPLYTEFIYRSYKESEQENSLENNKFIITTNSSLVNLIEGINVNQAVIFHISKNLINDSIVKSTFLDRVTSKTTTFNEWVTERINNIRLLVRWINLGDPLSPRKNNDLFRVLNSSDVVIHFTKRNSFQWNDTPSIHKFKTLAKKYYNSCFNKIKKIPKNVDTINYERMCKKNELTKLDIESCCLELKLDRKFCLPASNNAYIEKNLDFCGKINEFFSPEETKKMCCQSSGNLIKKQTEKRIRDKLTCEFVKIHPNSYKRSYEEKDISIIDTIPCYKNESLKFYLAPLKYLEYIKLIWNISMLKNDEVTILISKKNDAIYYEKNVHIDEKVFVKMLRNYRHKEKIGVLTKKESSIKESTNSTYTKNIVTRLSMNDFVNVIKFPTIQGNTPDHVILLSGGSSHGPTMAIMHIFHQLANYFLPFNKLIKFNIVDITEIDVPYSMKNDRIPALYFQSSKNLEQSSYFPKELPFTFPNVFAFIISRCQIELKWRIAITSCTNKCFSNNQVELDKYNNKINDFIRKSQTLQNSHNKLGLNKVIETKMMQRKLASELSKFISELDEKHILNFQQTIIKWVLYNFKT
uniref:Thioredoxin domain-containing protein n=1 Tax=Strongyloides papillosus TaxID=174720 RepID=A0A0N5C9S2_STREA